MAAATLALIDQTGKKIGTVKVAAAFTRPLNGALLHHAVLRQLANRRAGTAKTKKRDEVRGGGRKPWRQKGTGRARHGSIRSPIWRTGGVVFGPQPRSFEITLNKKARRSALAMAIGAKITAGAVAVVDPASLDLRSTKDFVHFVRPDGRSTNKVLILIHRADDGAAGTALARTGGNAARARVIGHTAIDPHAVLAHDRIVMTKHAYEALTQVCSD